MPSSPPCCLAQALAVAACLVVNTAARAEDAMLRAEPIGVAIRAIVYGNSHGVLAPSPGGHEGMFYIAYYSTTGSELLGYHSASGELVKSKLISSGGYGCCVASDGALYVGGVNPGSLQRFDPVTGQLEDLGGSQFGAQYIWATAAFGDKVYGGCYPTCSVLEYDVKTMELRDLGKMDEHEQYVRSICVDPQGRVWAGTGNKAHLVVLDPATGERHDVLPAEMRDNSCCYDLATSGKYVLGSILYDGTMAVFDSEAEQLVRVVPRPEGDLMWMNCHGAREGQAYLYASPSGSLYRYDIEGDKLTLLADSLGQCEQVVDARYVHGIDDQEYFVYDLQEGRELDRTKLTEAADGMAVQTLVGHSDGNLYGSTYINQHVFAYKPGGAIEDLGKAIRVGGQADSIHSGRDGKVYFGHYVRGFVSIYNPRQPWKPGKGKDGNPRDLGSVGAGQYRTQAIALGPDGRVWVGSIPSYNSAPTGALSCIDPETLEVENWLELVPGGAVSHMAVDDEYLYCAGGGVFFVWDPVTERKLYEEKRPISCLALAPGGEVVAGSGEEIVVFDPKAMQFAGATPSPIGALACIVKAPNGLLYGGNGEGVCEIDPKTWQARKVADEGGSFLSVDGEGTLYVARGAQVFRLR